jgi:peptide-methionine (S)-S-oxide reductase
LFLFKEFKNDIVTEVTKFENFYKSEDYHNNYFNDHTEESYCKFVVDPKVRKFLSKYKSVLKPEYK